MSQQSQTVQPISKRRNEYQKISDNFRKEIVKYWEDHRGVKTIKEMASNLRISRSTLTSITKIYEDTGRVESLKRGGCHYVKINDKHLQFIQSLVDENPSITLETIQSRLKLHFNMETPHSITGISYALKKRIEYSLKKIHKYPGRRNDPAIKDATFDYCNRLMVEGISYNHNCIFVDESGFNLWVTRGCARSKKGAPAFQIVSSQRKRNISLIAAMSTNGVEYCAVNNTTHGTNGEVFADYMKELYLYLERTNAPNQTIIMDNCPIHKSTVVQEILQHFPRHKVVFLPAWSPFLNPIEELFSKLKFYVKREYLDDTPTLLRKMEEGLRTISASDCQGWVSHSMSYFPRCIVKEDML